MVRLPIIDIGCARPLYSSRSRTSTGAYRRLLRSALIQLIVIPNEQREDDFAGYLTSAEQCLAPAIIANTQLSFIRRCWKSSEPGVNIPYNPKLLATLLAENFSSFTMTTTVSRQVYAGTKNVCVLEYRIRWITLTAEQRKGHTLG
nr:hypothetical protein CFP56_12931 [Quercus suber]